MTEGTATGPATALPVSRRVATRRAALGVGLAATASLAAGCAIGGSDEPLPGQAGQGASGSGAATDGPAIVTALDKIPLGGALAVTIDRRPAIVARKDQASVTAFSARCPHQGCTVLIAGPKIQCPCHGSQFDLLTGAVLRGPATANLAPIPVRIDGDEIVAG